MRNCEVYGNDARFSGGGIYNTGNVINCRVHHNKSGTNGGGIYNRSNIVDKCSVYENIAEKNGGGICNREDKEGFVVNCRIFQNAANEYGGGLYIVESEEVILYHNHGYMINCVIYENIAEYDGGGVYNIWGNIYNCVIYNNRAGEDASGIYNSNGYIRNSICWNNFRTDIEPNLTKVHYSCFGEAGETPDYQHNIKSNPKFMNISGDISTWDFHLQKDSPCIDAGSLLDYRKFEEKDVEGRIRPQGEDWDMGVYEYAENYALYLSRAAPEMAPVGEQFRVMIKMKNLGVSDWSMAEGYMLGCCVEPEELWGVTRIELPYSKIISPYETVEFAFFAAAPGEPGDYDFQWKMVRESDQTWFDESCPVQQIQVYLPGDVDNDGVLRFRDYERLQDHILGVHHLNEEECIRADINQDQFLNIADILCFYHKI